jgi:ATP-dependent phosphoenolpyruvate carboxykinase
VADPYAERTAPQGPLPAGPPPWLGLVAERGGIVLADADGWRDRGEARFAAVAVADAGILPPIAGITAAQAAMLLLGSGQGGSPPGVDDLEESGLPLYAIKHGPVAGPAGAPGSTEVEGELIAAVLDATDAGKVEWERDPDFGWLVPARVPGVGSPDAEALCPRLLYAAHDRVYEHAELVVEAKRRWHEAVSASGAPDVILAATGWPPEPTGKGWEESG